MRICKDECEMLEQKTCKVEYAVAKEHDLIGMSAFDELYFIHFDDL